MHENFLILKNENFIFCVFAGALIEQSLILNKKSIDTDENRIDYKERVRKSRIYICTTMYHEADFEMKQLLRSIAGIDNAAKRSSERQFESHIFLDDGARGQVSVKANLNPGNLQGSLAVADV